MKSKKQLIRGFECPACQAKAIKTIDSRPVVGGQRRRKQCLKCNHKFYSLETVEPVDIRRLLADNSSPNKGGPDAHTMESRQETRAEAASGSWSDIRTPRQDRKFFG